MCLRACGENTIGRAFYQHLAASLLLHEQKAYNSLMPYIVSKSFGQAVELSKSMPKYSCQYIYIYFLIKAYIFNNTGEES